MNNCKEFNMADILKNSYSGECKSHIQEKITELKNKCSNEDEFNKELNNFYKKLNTLNRR